jgi:hypothetical protein
MWGTGISPPLVLAFEIVIPTEREFCATEESAVVAPMPDQDWPKGFGKGTASAMP